MIVLCHTGRAFRGPEKSEYSAHRSEHSLGCDLPQVASVSSATSGSDIVVPVEGTVRMTGAGWCGAPSECLILDCTDDCALLGARHSTVGPSGCHCCVFLCEAQGKEVNHLYQSPVGIIFLWNQENSS